ncbi:jerky protein homolog-like [Bombus vosnesenskii]|uniref:Jerky protein homolog-like n=1 Tax=Bombus vosnesenskii TaxID=207650 RepID=A0A6J3L9G0_9HYME|nr:jerky protein homolog-like [Bombus vosnesenskii]
MTSRRKPLYLTITDKYNILMMRDRGEIRQTIMEKYGVALSTLHTIYVKSEEITKQYGLIMGLTRRRLQDVDKVVYQWYLRCKERKVQMTGADIQREALEINEKLNGHPRFKASTTWLRGFKERYNITTADIRQNIQAANEFTAAEAFKADFNRFLQEGGFTLRNVYNAVYTTVMWKAVPENSCIFNRAKSTGNLEMCEDYVTALFCANATGCHTMPVLIIGNPQSSSVLNTDIFPTIYNVNTKVWMDSSIFKQWYKEYFLESIKERQRENGSEDKYLLLVDNIMSLHDVNDINNIDPLVEVKSPPPNAAALSQPMNCGIITCFKRKYRIELLKTIRPLSIYNTEEEVIDLYKELCVWDFCRFVNDAWTLIGHSILVNSWDNLLRPIDMRRTQYTETWDADISNAVELLHTLPGCEQCQKVHVFRWFNMDNGHDIIKKVCTNEVLREFKNDTLCPVNINIIDDEAGPSRAKFSKRS